MALLLRDEDLLAAMEEAIADQTEIAISDLNEKKREIARNIVLALRLLPETLQGYVDAADYEKQKA